MIRILTKEQAERMEKILSVEPPVPDDVNPDLYEPDSEEDE